MTQLITIPKFAEATGLPYRLCLHLVETHQIPSVPVGRRRRIDVRWVDQWLAVGGYCPPAQDSSTRHQVSVCSSHVGEPTSAAR
jgi:excisionase family DNA binding protein